MAKRFWMVIATNTEDLENPLYWSNSAGWTDRYSDPDEFSDDEKSRFHLPVGGEWVEVTPA